MFSNCSGPCIVCICSGRGCLAGHGDDDFYALPLETIEQMVETKYHPNWDRALTDANIDEITRYLAKKR